ncbi:16S rRNA (uracil(1498)-N(3))-methyltransferase [Thalassotalea nanhaiensis]|uniref:Ribosomal RNA small subunit methyltransferase E n=1 Tax=Thalassotalea nanhaiensis TaxID=3065648 RepID=A0ABY9TG86_9GAMM|nr:16S rRNA (uracil(1498)-N(3))-methyltransferase [Colwelliaceae bacterium SQ345]
MSNPRIFQATPFSVDSTATLSDDAFGHVVRVLRLKAGDEVTFFNGDGCDYQAILSDVSKKQATANIVNKVARNNESPLNIHLGQGISRGDRMDFTLQKSVELGVNTITPLFTQRCGVKLNAERLEKKRQQWQKIVISACEQSGRAVVPEVRQPMALQEWLTQATQALTINLHPRAEHSIMGLPVSCDRVRLLIGPEGGLTDEEIQQASNANYTEVLLGPRVLRTETAALTAITALQCKFGDLS